MLQLQDNTLITISVFFLLAIFHNLTQLDLILFNNLPIDWQSQGNAHSAEILAGQWWRLITALTLHGDWLHLLSNLVIGGIFIVYLCRELGSGLAWSLLLGTGVLGNLANACLQLPEHSSIGSSTLVFGAVGILAALNQVRHHHYVQRHWPLPVASAMALLALLGSEGKNTDLGAHLFGFIFGLVLGSLTESLVVKHGRPGKALNALLTIACAMLVLTAWFVAVSR